MPKGLQRREADERERGGARKAGAARHVRDLVRGHLHHVGHARHPDGRCAKHAVVGSEELRARACPCACDDAGKVESHAEPLDAAAAHERVQPRRQLVAHQIFGVDRVEARSHHVDEHVPFARGRRPTCSLAHRDATCGRAAVHECPHLGQQRCGQRG